EHPTRSSRRTCLVTKTARITSGVILLAACVSACAADAPRTLSEHEYVVEIERLSSLADSIREQPDAANHAISELRGNWKVQADGHDFFVDTGWLIDRFRKGTSDDQARSELKARLDELAKEAAAFEQPGQDSGASRAKLDQILARGEFHQVHG